MYKQLIITPPSLRAARIARVDNPHYTPSNVLFSTSYCGEKDVFFTLTPIYFHPHNDTETC